MIMMKLILIYLLIIKNVNLIACTSCSIYLSLNCSCFQSDSDLLYSSSTSVKTYSYLYCQGNSLNEKTFQSPYGFDYFKQNQFRTISIEFRIDKQIDIVSNQFDSLGNLFSQTDEHSKIEITIRFIDFTQISFHRKSLTSNMFNNKHINRYLSLYFLPKLSSNSSAEEENQFKFDVDCFSGLTVKQLNMYLHTIKIDNSFKYPFELVFNQTNIDQLHFYDSIIQPGSSLLKKSFKGLVKSLTLHRRVDTIDSQTYPYYNTVHSYNIHSIEGHSIDLNSFVSSYENLDEIELVQPHFHVSIDRFVPSLKSLSIDIEYLNEKTLLSARHISKLKLTSNLRRITPNIFKFHLYYLKLLDLSQINLSEMLSDSRCYLIEFLIENSNKITILYPKTDQYDPCHCIRLILQQIQFKKQSNEQILCSKQCRFSDCFSISQYYTNKYPFDNLDFNENSILNEENVDLPSIDLYSDPKDMDIIIFLNNQTDNQQSISIHRESTVNLRASKTKNSFWLNPFVLSICIVLILIFFLFILLFFVIKYQKDKRFQPVPVYI